MGTPPQPRYVQLRLRRPASAWPVARALVLALFAAVVALLVFRPATGLLVFWGLVVPVLPLTWVLVPGLWRNVCPMASANQLPRKLGITRARPLPHWLERHGYGVGVLLFFGLIAARPALLERSGAALALLLGMVIVTPFIGGVLFKGKSGFCGSICPLRPVQGLYARAPALPVEHAHCSPCVGCTPDCQDLKPTRALLDELRSADPVRAGYRRLFAGALPGFSYAFFTLPADMATPALVLRLALAIFIGVGALTSLQALTKLSDAQATALSGAASLSLFYWFRVALVAGTIGKLTGTEVQPWAVWEGRAVVVMLIAAWLVRSWRAAAGARAGAAPPVPVAAPVAFEAPPAGISLPMVMSTPAPAVAAGQPVVAGEPPVQIPDRRSPDRPLRQPRVTLWPEGRQVDVEPGATLVAALAAVGVDLPRGCGTGLCGADPVYVMAGGDQLSPAGEDERSTASRMGLPVHARLACSTRVHGDVTISQSADAHPLEPVVAAAEPPPRVPTAGTQERVVIIGNGVAGVTAAGHVRRLDHAAELSLVTDSPHLFYNRIAIARLIHEPTGMQGLQLMPTQWYDEQRIAQWLNTRVARVDRERREVVLAMGETLPYDRLILATGATAASPPIAGIDLDGVFNVRRAEDGLAVRAYAQRQECKRAVVIGGGLLGLEAADAIARLGLAVTVVEGGAWLGHRELDERSGELLREHLLEQGMEARVGAGVRAITGTARVAGVELAGGLELEADLVLVCAGIRPNTQIAKDAGLAVARGIVVDAHMRTSDPHILACGDVTEFDGQLFGRWATAVTQAEVAAVTALGGQRTFEPVAIPTKLSLSGLDLLSIGRKDGGPGDEELVQDLPGRRYRKLVLSGQRVIGAIAFGDPPAHEPLAEAVRQARDVQHSLDALRSGDWTELGVAPLARKRRRVVA